MPFRFTRHVEFRDTDAAGIVHFSVFFNYMEAAEHAFWRSLGVSVLTQDDLGPISWPRVAVSCQYNNPLRFEDQFAVEVQVARLGRTSVTFDFLFSRNDESIAVGQMTAVCCRLTDEGRPVPTPVPESIAEKLRAV